MVVNTVKNIKQDDVLENFTDPELYVTFRSKFDASYNYPKTMKYDIHQEEVWVSTTFAFPASDGRLLADSTQLLTS